MAPFDGGMALVTMARKKRRISTVAWFGGRCWLVGDAFEGVAEQRASVVLGVGRDGGALAEPASWEVPRMLSLACLKSCD